MAKLLRSVKTEVEKLPELEFMPFRAPASRLENTTGVCAANATAQCYAAVLHHQMMKLPYKEKVKLKNEMSQTRYGRFLLSMLGWWHPRKFDTQASWQCTEGQNKNARVSKVYFYFPVEHVLPLKKLLSMDYLQRSKVVDRNPRTAALWDAKLETTSHHTTHLGFMFDSTHMSYRILMEHMYNTSAWKWLDGTHAVVDSLNEDYNIEKSSGTHVIKRTNLTHTTPLNIINLPQCPPYVTFFHSGQNWRQAQEAPTHFFMYRRGEQVRYNFLCGMVVKNHAQEKEVRGQGHATAICRYMDRYYELDDGQVQEVNAVVDFTAVEPVVVVTKPRIKTEPMQDDGQEVEFVREVKAPRETEISTPNMQEPIEDSYEDPEAEPYGDTKMHLDASQNLMSNTWTWTRVYFDLLIYAKDETGPDDGRQSPAVV